jgi:hypothetical protein
MADSETNCAMNDDTILLIIYFDGNFPNAKLCPYDDYKNYFCQIYENVDIMFIEIYRIH